MKPKTDAQEQAISLLKESAASEVPVNLEKIASHLDVSISFQDFEDDMSGVLVVKNGRRAIGVNRTHHTNRQRFTIAHELGHLVLHHEHSNNDVHLDKKWAYFRSTAKMDPREVEANQFAAELLMPEPQLRAIIKTQGHDLTNDRDIETLSQLFKVSEKALAFRLINLGLVKTY